MTYKNKVLISTFMAFLLHAGLSNATDIHIGDAVDNPLTTDGVTINEPIFGGKLYYYEMGPKNGRPAVLVHGLGEEGIDHWRYVAEMLSKNYRVILLDLPGFGRSGRERAIYSPAQYTKLLNWFIHQRTSKPVTLIGHSMGAAISLYYAATYPEHLEQLVVFDVAGILHRAAFTKHFIEMAELDNPMLDGFSSKSTSAVNEWIMSMLSGAETLVRPIEMVMENPAIGKHFVKRFPPSAVAAFALAQTDFSRVINKITTHTTIIWGEEDRVSSPRVAHLLNKRITGSQLYWIEKAGHSPILKNIDATNRVLKKVLIKSKGQQTDQSYRSIKYAKRSRKGSCTNQNGINFTGYYSELRIIGCTRIKLDNVTTPSLYISDSDVSALGGYYLNNNTAITVENSLLKMTNSEIAGKIAIKSSGSKLDFAGVDIKVDEKVIEATGSTILICSICEVSEPEYTGTVHDIYSLGPEIKFNE